MKRLIDTITRFAIAGGGSSGGSCDGTLAQSTEAPTTIHGRPAVRLVKGENPDPDFLEVFVLGDENGRTNIYQCEADTAGKFDSQWWKIIAKDPADLQDAPGLEFTNLRTSTATPPGPYPRAVKTGSRTYDEGATACTSSSPGAIFQLSGRGPKMCYKQTS